MATDVGASALSQAVVCKSEGAVSIIQSDDKITGRFAVAARALAIGDIVLRCRPLVSSLNRGDSEVRCAVCWQENESSGGDANNSDDDDDDVAMGETPADTMGCAYECPECYAFVVCAKCQVGGKCRDYVTTHEASGDCALMQEGEHADTTARMLVALEYLSKMSAKPAPQAEIQGSREASFNFLDELESHEELSVIRDKEAEHQQFATMVMAAAQGGAMQAPSTETVQRWVRWLCLMRHNQHALNNDVTGEPLGNCLCPEASLFNHSCRPNIKKITDGVGGLIFVAMAPIDMGSPLCISYTAEGTPKLQRLARLQEVWHFDCVCARCSDPDDSDDRTLVQLAAGVSKDRLGSCRCGAIASGDKCEDGQESKSATIPCTGECVGVSASSELESNVLAVALGGGGDVDDHQVSALVKKAVDDLSKLVAPSHHSMAAMRAAAAELLDSFGMSVLAAEQRARLACDSGDSKTMHADGELYARAAIAMLQAARDIDEGEGGGDSDIEDGDEGPTLLPAANVEDAGGAGGGAGDGAGGAGATSPDSRSPGALASQMLGGSASGARRLDRARRAEILFDEAISRCSVSAGRDHWSLQLLQRFKEEALRTSTIVATLSSIIPKD